MTFSKIYTSNSPIWDQSNTILFNELILSWNGERPKGKWTFWVSFYEDEWLKYAEWGSNGQKSFKSKLKHSKCYQDVAVPEKPSTFFRIKVEGDEIHKLKRLTVCLSLLENYRVIHPGPLKETFIKDVPKLSQMCVNHPRHKDLCSPTSTTIVTNFLLKKNKIDPKEMAELSLDQEFDIYGNWILNVAASYSFTKHPCHVERLNSFSDLHALLLRGVPVITSVKGPLPKAPKPYAAGHLMCVVGYSEGKVHCIDPGFEKNEETAVSYDLNDFLTCWSRRKNLAYVFSA